MYSNYYLIGWKSQLDNREYNAIYSENVSTFKRSETLRSIVWYCFGRRRDNVGFDI